VSKTVLVVDDEEPVREMLGELLETSGFEVLLADDGADAVDVLRVRRGHVDLILLDGTPYESRRATLLQVQAVRPGVPVVVMSGKPWVDLKPEFEGLPVAGYLPKPCSLEKILELVDTLLGS
jgi:DNA-binding NtrC family response regulator